MQFYFRFSRFSGLNFSFILFPSLFLFCGVSLRHRILRRSVSGHRSLQVPQTSSSFCGGWKKFLEKGLSSSTWKLLNTSSRWRRGMAALAKDSSSKKRWTVLPFHTWNVLDISYLSRSVLLTRLRIPVRRCRSDEMFVSGRMVMSTRRGIS